MNKKLYLSDTDKKLTGVCGGFAEFFEIDPTIVRILYLAMVLFGGCGLLFYLICWIVMPKKNHYMK